MPASKNASGAWTGSLEVYALACVNDTRIIVYSEDLAPQVYNEQATAEHHICELFFNGSHYEWLESTEKVESSQDAIAGSRKGRRGGGKGDIVDTMFNMLVDDLNKVDSDEGISSDDDDFVSRAPSVCPTQSSKFDTSRISMSLRDVNADIDDGICSIYSGRKSVTGASNNRKRKFSDGSFRSRAPSTGSFHIKIKGNSEASFRSRAPSIAPSPSSKKGKLLIFLVIKKKRKRRVVKPTVKTREQELDDVIDTLPKEGNDYWVTDRGTKCDLTWKCPACHIVLTGKANAPKKGRGKKFNLSRMKCFHIGKKHPELLGTRLGPLRMTALEVLSKINESEPFYWKCKFCELGIQNAVGQSKCYKARRDHWKKAHRWAKWKEFTLPKGTAENAKLKRLSWMHEVKEQSEHLLVKRTVLNLHIKQAQKSKTVISCRKCALTKWNNDLFLQNECVRDEAFHHRVKGLVKYKNKISKMILAGRIPKKWCNAAAETTKSIRDLLNDVKDA